MKRFLSKGRGMAEVQSIFPETLKAAVARCLCSGQLIMSCVNFPQVLRSFGLSGWERNQFVNTNFPNTSWDSRSRLITFLNGNSVTNIPVVFGHMHMFDLVVKCGTSINVKNKFIMMKHIMGFTKSINSVFERQLGRRHPRGLRPRAHV